jgi:hypothetical protein
MAMRVLIGVLIILSIGAICFWSIDRFAPDRRVANPLELVVVAVCLVVLVRLIY